MVVWFFILKNRGHNTNLFYVPKIYQKEGMETTLGAGLLYSGGERQLRQGIAVRPAREVHLLLAELEKPGTQSQFPAENWVMFPYFTDVS